MSETYPEKVAREGEEITAIRAEIDKALAAKCRAEGRLVRALDGFCQRDGFRHLECDDTLNEGPEGRMDQYREMIRHYLGPADDRIPF